MPIPVMLSPPVIRMLAGARSAGSSVQAMHQQRLLARDVQRDRVVVQHFQIVDAIQRRIAQHRGFAIFIAAA